MSHIRPVPSPQKRFGGLSSTNTAPSPPRWKYENYKLVEFCPFLQCQGMNRETKTHTKHNVEWFSPELILTTISGYFQLGTTSPPLLSGWKSPGFSIPGVGVIFSEKVKVISSAVSAQLCPPKMLPKAPLMMIYKKSCVMLHLEAEWTSKQNILIADTILAEPGP